MLTETCRGIFSYIFCQFRCCKTTPERHGLIRGVLLPRDPRNAYLIEENNGEETFVLDPSYAVLGREGTSAQEDVEAEGIEMEVPPENASLMEESDREEPSASGPMAG